MDVSDKVFGVFQSFVQDLAKTYPEIKSCLYRNYEECLVGDNPSLDECPKLQRFLDLIHENDSWISKKDMRFLQIDNILEEISFEKLWSKNISDKTRDTIWKYFQTFSLLTVNLKSGEAFQEAMKALQGDGEITDKEVASELRKIKRLAEGVQKEIPESASGGEVDLEGMLGGMMDTNIGQIAKEVAETMDVEKMFGDVTESTNPMEIMSQMMNPEKMGGIFKNIQSVMDQKMQTGEFDRDDLKREAEGMYGSMATNPMFSGLMSQMNPGKGPTVEEMPPEPEPGLSREEKRKRLQDKIKQKQKDRTG